MTPAELVAWRKEHGVTQRQLSRRLGVTISTISRWEMGLRSIPPYLALALSALKQKRVTTAGIAQTALNNY